METSGIVAIAIAGALGIVLLLIFIVAVGALAVYMLDKKKKRAIEQRAGPRGPQRLDRSGYPLSSPSPPYSRRQTENSLSANETFVHGYPHPPSHPVNPLHNPALHPNFLDISVPMAQCSESFADTSPIPTHYNDSSAAGSNRRVSFSPQRPPPTFPTHVTVAGAAPRVAPHSRPFFGGPPSVAPVYPDANALSIVVVGQTGAMGAASAPQLGSPAVGRPPPQPAAAFMDATGTGYPQMDGPASLAQSVLAHTHTMSPLLPLQRVSDDNSVVPPHLLIVSPRPTPVAPFDVGIPQTPPRGLAPATVAAAAAAAGALTPAPPGTPPPARGYRVLHEASASPDGAQFETSYISSSDASPDAPSAQRRDDADAPPAAPRRRLGRTAARGPQQAPPRQQTKAGHRGSPRRPSTPSRDSVAPKGRSPAAPAGAAPAGRPAGRSVSGTTGATAAADADNHPPSTAMSPVSGGSGVHAPGAFDPWGLPPAGFLPRAAHTHAAPAAPASYCPPTQSVASIGADLPPPYFTYTLPPPTMGGPIGRSRMLPDGSIVPASPRGTETGGDTVGTRPLVFSGAAGAWGSADIVGPTIAMHATLGPTMLLPSFVPIVDDAAQPAAPPRRGAAGSPIIFRLGAPILAGASDTTATRPAAAVGASTADATGRWSEGDARVVNPYSSAVLPRHEHLQRSSASPRAGDVGRTEPVALFATFPFSISFPEDPERKAPSRSSPARAAGRSSSTSSSSSGWGAGSAVEWSDRALPSPRRGLPSSVASPAARGSTPPPGDAMALPPNLRRAQQSLSPRGLSPGVVYRAPSMLVGDVDASRQHLESPSVPVPVSYVRDAGRYGEVQSRSATGPSAQSSWRFTPTDPQAGDSAASALTLPIAKRNRSRERDGGSPPVPHPPFPSGTADPQPHPTAPLSSAIFIHHQRFTPVVGDDAPYAHQSLSSLVSFAMPSRAHSAAPINHAFAHSSAPSAEVPAPPTVSAGIACNEPDKCPLPRGTIRAAPTLHGTGLSPSAPRGASRPADRAVSAEGSASPSPNTSAQRAARGESPVAAHTGVISARSPKSIPVNSQRHGSLRRATVGGGEEDGAELPDRLTRGRH